MSLLAAIDVHVLDGCGVGGEKQRHGTPGSAAEGTGEPQDRQRTQETAGIDFEVGHPLILSPRGNGGPPEAWNSRPVRCSE